MTNIDLKDFKFSAERSEDDLYEEIRSDLEDSLKEYSELDLIVELLQNALDAMDERRYRSICNSIGVSHADHATILAWNKTVSDLMKEDYDSFPNEGGASKRAVWQSQMGHRQERRERWAQTLIKNLALDESCVQTVLAQEFQWATLGVAIELGAPNRVTIRDSGLESVT